MMERESANMNLRVSMNPPDLLHGIVTAGMERVALGQPQGRQPDRSQGSFLLKRLDGVF